MQFRTDISFLRAISVLMVMFFHFQIPIFKGGFIGVDIFFVISGFLMTQITLNAFDNNNFSLKEFYLKRVKRIIPALQFVLYFVLLISIIFFLATDIKLNSKYVLLANFFGSNIYFWQYLNYFSSKDNILLHTWSLGVEWQFYIIYPLILLVLKNYYLTKEKIFWIIMTILTLLSFILVIAVYKTENNFSFYMLPTRYWELSIGGLAYGFMRLFRVGDFSKKIIFLISITLILVSVYLISENNIWPSYLTVIPVLATTSILLCNVQSKLFDNNIVNFLGNISYSLYLWHWPWFIVFKYFGFLETEHVVILTLLSFVSAIISHNYIEKNKFFSKGKVILISTILLSVLSVMLFLKPTLFKNFSIYQNKKYEIGNYHLEYINKHREKQFNPCNCYVTDGTNISSFNKEKCLLFVTNKKNILLIGDSHMAQFSSSFRKYDQYNWMEASFGYVLPLSIKNGIEDRWKIQNEVLNSYVFSSDSKVDLVIISAHWLMRVNPNINLSENQVLFEIEKMMKKLQNSNRKFLFIGQSEAYSLSYPKIQMLSQFGRDENKFLSQEAFDINKKLNAIIPKQNYLDIYNNPQINKVNNKGDGVYMFDGNHFSNFGADQYMDKLIMPKVDSLLKN